MGKWEIAKEFGFDYGHRVHTQTLDEEYSIDTACVCRHLHGHRGTLIVYLEGNSLNQQGMIVDFKMLNWFKQFVDDVLDHKFIMDINDPLFKHEVPCLYDPDDGYFWAEWLLNHPEGYKTISQEAYENEPKPIQEKYEGMVFVDFVPTSENLAKWLHGIVSEKMAKIGVSVSRVQLFETPKSQANYFG